jgi:hypothetical protein
VNYRPPLYNQDLKLSSPSVKDPFNDNQKEKFTFKINAIFFNFSSKK